ncbi:MAG: CHAP domain-containing protein [Lactobacillales bacterium]|nr:CHAP domain-containing protein [Lactobacillales bacterium]
MRKRVFSFLIIGMLGIVACFVTHVNAKQDEIIEKSKKIEVIQSQETAAVQELSSIQGELDHFATKEKELSEENTKLMAHIVKSDEKIIRSNMRIAQRKKKMEDQARSVQMNSADNSMVHVLMESNSITEFVTRYCAICSILSASNKIILQQKKDLEVVKKERDVSFSRTLQLQKNQVELEQAKKTIEQRRADLLVAQINLSAQRVSEEGARNILLAQKAAAQVAAEEVAKRQKVELQQLRQAQRNSQEQCRSYVPSRSYSGGGIVDGPSMNWTVDHGFYWGQCTWYANLYFGYGVPYTWGNACTWGSAARADGRFVSRTPRARTIACYQSGCDGASSFGHVAVVECVNGDGTYNISESNVKGLGVVSHRYGLRPKPGVQFIYMD